MILIGLGVVAQTVLSADAAGGPLSIHIGWGVGVALAVYVAGGVSAHLNPAVTLAMVCFGDTPLCRLPTYVLAQILGAFSGAAVVFGLYREALDAFDASAVHRNVTNASTASFRGRAVGGVADTAGIFATYPATLAGGVVASNTACAATEVVGTAVLVAGILALSDRDNAVAPGDALAPFMVGQVREGGGGGGGGVKQGGRRREGERERGSVGKERDGRGFLGEG
jgi:glycerol uptake facilitator-like aquaporin